MTSTEYMDSFLSIELLDHIGYKIFSYLDPVSLKNCSEVSKKWHQFITENKKWWSVRAEYLYEKIETWAKEVKIKDPIPIGQTSGIPGFDIDHNNRFNQIIKERNYKRYSQNLADWNDTVIKFFNDENLHWVKRLILFLENNASILKLNSDPVLAKYEYCYKGKFLRLLDMDLGQNGDEFMLKLARHSQMLQRFFKDSNIHRSCLMATANGWVNLQKLLLSKLIEKGFDFNVPFQQGNTDFGDADFIFIHYLFGESRLSKPDKRCFRSNNSIFSNTEEMCFEALMNVLQIGTIDFDVTNGDGETYLHRATNTFDNPQLNIKLVDFFLQKNIDINAKDEGGETPLMHALDYPDGPETEDVAMHLLDQDGIELCNPDVDVQEMHMIVYAAFNGRLQVVKRLLEMDPSLINKRSKCGHSLLHAAVSSFCSVPNLELIKLLLHCGIEINAKHVNTGRTVLHALIPEPLPPLPIIGAPPILFKKDCMELLLRQENIDVNAIDHYGNTPFHCLCQLETSIPNDVADLFCNHPDIDVNAVDFHGKTPLHYALKNNHFNIYKKNFELAKKRMK